MERNVSIHISDRSHVNLTLNVYNCGRQDLELEQMLKPDHYILYYVKEGKAISPRSRPPTRCAPGRAS